MPAERPDDYDRYVNKKRLLYERRHQVLNNNVGQKNQLLDKKLGITIRDIQDKNKRKNKISKFRTFKNPNKSIDKDILSSGSEGSAYSASKKFQELDRLSNHN